MPGVRQRWKRQSQRKTQDTDDHLVFVLFRLPLLLGHAIAASRWVDTPRNSPVLHPRATLRHYSAGHDVYLKAMERAPVARNTILLPFRVLYLYCRLATELRRPLTGAARHKAASVSGACSEAVRLTQRYAVRGACVLGQRIPKIVSSDLSTAAVNLRHSSRQNNPGRKCQDYVIWSGLEISYIFWQDI